MADTNQLSFYRKLRRQLGQVPLIRRAYDELDILVKYRQYHPERVPLANSQHVIFVDPRELRGRAILRTYGSGQGLLKSIWRHAVASLQPNVVLDVGANYGEFLFMMSYASDASILGIEANPSLMRYLERSRQAHPQRDCIDLVCALAAAEDGPERDFFVDCDWSGRSSALRQTKHRNTIVEKVKTVAVDSLLADRMPADSRLLFKIDVEGYEPPVIAGMTRTLEKAKSAVGILELNTTFLRTLGVDPQAFVSELQERFTVIGFRDHVRPVDLTSTSLKQALGDEPLLTDLVLTTDVSLLPRDVR